MKKVLRDGTVVGGSGSARANVLIGGEEVAAVGTSEEVECLADEDTQTVDVEGCLFFPGFIDAHTHFDLHMAGTIVTDGFATGTEAAVRGGTTTIVDSGTQHEEESLADGPRSWHEEADGKRSRNYEFHIFASDWDPSTSRELDDMIEARIISFRLYMTCDTQMDDKTIFEILCRLKEARGIIGVHCENSGMVAAPQAEARVAGKTGVEGHSATRPAAVEAEAIGRLLRLIEVVDIPVVVMHLICREGYDVIMEIRRRGQKVYVKICPQYLLMDGGLYELVGMERAKHVYMPPLRKQEGDTCLWEALADGVIRTVSTGHCSFIIEQKVLGKGDFTKIPGGMPGVETRGMLLYTYDVDTGRITKEKVCQFLLENPVKLYGMYPTKGAIAPGSDAGIAVMRTDVKDMVTAADQAQDVDCAPFEGRKLTARTGSVLLHGVQVVKDHQVVVERVGKSMKRGRYGL